MSRHFWHVSPLLVAMALVASPATAQMDDVMQLKGKLQQAFPQQGIAMSDPMNNNQPVLIQITPSTKCSVDGTADPSFLGPGVPVQLTAEMTRLGVVQGEIAELMICDINQTNVPTFSPDDPTQATSKEKDAVGKYFARGTVMSNKNGQLQIKTPGALVKGKLSDSVKIKVAVSDYTWAKEGDAVVVDGKKIEPGKIVATVVQITLAAPLEAPKKKLPVRKATGAGT
jgi:hypothetical protein